MKLMLRAHYCKINFMSTTTKDDILSGCVTDYPEDVLYVGMGLCVRVFFF